MTAYIYCLIVLIERPTVQAEVNDNIRLLLRYFLDSQAGKSELVEAKRQTENLLLESDYTSPKAKKALYYFAEQLIVSFQSTFSKDGYLGLLHSHIMAQRLDSRWRSIQELIKILRNQKSLGLCIQATDAMSHIE